ncbi:MAG: HlyD family efflux transporter periplasmic adaptor subunit [Sterolibacterium sp.]|nr:HlyD family efflux transporter periplasmic adaptor subunit [Sterolibacterium sp.]
MIQQQTSQVTLADFAVHLEARARAAGNLAELGFSMANDVHSVLPFRQALVLDAKSKALTISGLVKLTEDSPYILWLKRAWPWVVENLSEHGGWFAPLLEQLAAAPDDVADGWEEWWPIGVLALPLQRRDGELLGWVAFLLDQPPSEELIHLLGRVGQTWAYCWEMLAGKPRRGLKARWQGLSKWQQRIVLAAVLVFLLLPVRQTALAPAEVVAADAMAITAALDGVVKTIHVRPNQAVRAGDRLFSLDDTTLRNRLEVARKSVAVADAELQAATQMAFDDSRSKSELAALTGRAQEKRAELIAVEAQLARVDALAPYDGIAVFADPDDWQGRPVVTGERIMLLANPAKPALLVHLPVADAISLDVGAPVKFFLTVRPLSLLSGQVSETSYQASLESDGVVSYRLRATLNEKDARIGLRGTAKLYGGWVTLGYYVMRRPLAKLRELSGW